MFFKFNLTALDFFFKKNFYKNKNKLLTSHLKSFYCRYFHLALVQNVMPKAVSSLKQR